MSIINEEVLNYFSSALIETLQVMGMISVEIKDKFSEFSNKKYYFNAGMRIKGENILGVISISMNKEAAILIAESMTGEEVEESSEILNGISSEITNMVAGRTKASLSGHKYHFNLTNPFILDDRNISEDNPFNHYKENFTRLDFIGDVEIELSVSFLEI